MKTPEQIAHEITLPRVIVSGKTILDLMVTAIEADRAQRPIFADGQPNNDAILTGEW